MFQVVAIMDDKSTSEFEVCCPYHARIFCRRDHRIVWWEVFDEDGDMVDFVDNANESESSEGHCGGGLL